MSDKEREELDGSSRPLCVECGIRSQTKRTYKSGNIGYREKCEDCQRPGRVFKRHGLTEAAYNQMLIDQQGVCKVCLLPETASKSSVDETPRSLAIHHNHNCCPGKYSCGKCIIGLLCSNCNTGIGLLKDSPKILLRAYQVMVEYNEGGFDDK